MLKFSRNEWGYSRRFMADFGSTEGIKVVNTIRKIMVFSWQLNAPAFKWRGYQF